MLSSKSAGLGRMSLARHMAVYERILRVPVIIAILLGTQTTARSETLQVSSVASRTSGAAPLAVFFDATGTTCSACAKPFHDLHYSWDFGDPGSGNWTTRDRSRNQALGPTAAHVFERPGTYRVTLNVLAGDGSSQQIVTTINVVDPELQWPGEATYCFSTQGVFTGCPAGASRITASSFNDAMTRCASAARRCLFRRGETFSSTEVGLKARGPGLIGAFGSDPSRPKVRFANDGFSMRFFGGAHDWRLVDLEFQGSASSKTSIMAGEGAVNNLLILRTAVVPGTYHAGLSLSGTALDYYGSDLHDGVFVVENEWRDFGFGSGGTIVFMAARRMALMGNTFDDSIGGEHVIRVQHGEKGVISYNNLGRQAAAKHVLTVRSRNLADSCSGGCGRRSKEFVISENTFLGLDDVTVALTQRNKSTDTAGGQDFIVERNFFAKGTGVDHGLQVALFTADTDNVTVRNNIVLMKDWQGYRGIQLNGTSNAYNNSCFAPGSSTGAVRCVVTDATAKASNNILFGPNAADLRVVDGPGDSGGNLEAAQTSPFSSASPTQPPDFRLTDGSMARDAGIPIGANLVDYDGNPRPSGSRFDVGAFELQDGAPPPAGTLPLAPVLLD